MRAVGRVAGRWVPLGHPGSRLQVIGAGVERTGASRTRLLHPGGCKSFHDDRQFLGKEDGLHSDVSSHVPGRATPSQVRVCLL